MVTLLEKFPPFPTGLKRILEKVGKVENFPISKKRIFAPKTSKNLKLQKWTPFGSRSPQSKVMSIFLKSPEHDIVKNNFRLYNFKKSETPKMDPIWH